jgi:hypothetical protein
MSDASAVCMGPLSGAHDRDVTVLVYIGDASLGLEIGMFLRRCTIYPATITSALSKPSLNIPFADAVMHKILSSRVRMKTMNPPVALRGVNQGGRSRNRLDKL